MSNQIKQIKIKNTTYDIAVDLANVPHISELKDVLNPKVNLDDHTVNATVIKQLENKMDTDISDLKEALQDVNTVMNFRGAVEATSEIDEPKNGDVVVITKGEDAGKEFVYDNSKADWIEIGDEHRFTTDGILLTKDLVFTEPFGKYGTAQDKPTQKALNETGFYTIDTSDGHGGKISLQTLFDRAYASDKAPIVTQPSITLTPTKLGDYEVGSEVTVGWTFENNTEGRYQYGPATGVTWSGYEVSLDAQTLTNYGSGSFSPIIITDNMNLELTWKASHSDATAVPKTALGGDYDAGKISASTKTGTISNALRGYRNMFAGGLTLENTDITSANIRSLDSKKASGSVQNWSVTIPEGTRKAIIAIPEERTLTKVLDVNDSNSNITEAFTKNLVEVAVNGANDYTPKTYKVYCMDYAIAAVENKLLVTIS